MDVIKRNFKGLYLFSLIYTLFGLMAWFVYESPLGTPGILIYWVLVTVIYTGWQWYILNIYRNNENKNILKTIACSIGWIIILDLVKLLVIVMLSTVLYFLIQGLFDGVWSENDERILNIIINWVISSLFVFTEFIYYDKKDRGPLSAVFDSMKAVRKVFGKVFFIYLFALVPDIINLLYFNIAKEHEKLGIVIYCLRYLWIFVVFPMGYVKICGIYESIKKEESEINDSLTVVARALDDEMNKN